MPKWLTAILALSLDRLLLLACVSLIILSFDPIRYQNNKFDFCLNKLPNLWLFVPSIFLLILFFWRQRDQRLRKTSTESIRNGYRLRFNSNHSISVKTGDIVDFNGGEHAAVILPANTSFDDQCIRDDRSALGSFCKKHFPNGIDRIQKVIREAAIEACKATEETFTSAPTGTTILLNNPLGSAFKIMISAVTTIDPEQGITADTLSLLASVKQVFRVASQNRISSLTMPVMGTGHGGLDFKAALSLLLVQCMYSMQYEGAHHVHDVTVIIYDPEGSKRNLMDQVIQAVGKLTHA